MKKHFVAYGGIIAACIAAFMLYAPGLSGPFLFDDFWNLEPLRGWHEGQHSWRQALLPNPQSILASRPVAMASFLLSVWLGGTDSVAFKLGNLVLHLACGIAIWRLCRHALTADRSLHILAAPAALVITTLWLLHPLHVSTVLYAVQRMAQLAALFSLLALLVYITGRRQIVAGHTRAGATNLFLVFPLVVGAGVLSKQNAAVAPLLCLVYEFAYHIGGRRPAALRAFFGLFAFVPAAAGLLLLAFNPAIVTSGYSDWDFTLPERLMTQARALVHYAGMLVVPRSDQMGLYTDDFAVSRGFLAPLSTLPAMFFLLAASTCAIALRRQGPTIFFGWFFFLIAHAVESGPLALEMYYEHRNYLPSAGLLLSLFGSLHLLSLRFRWRPAGSPIALLCGALLLVLAFATLGRVLVWQSLDSIAIQGIQQHPRSLRAISDNVTRHAQRGEFDAAAGYVRPLIDDADPRRRIYGNLYLVVIQCGRGELPDDRLLATAAAEALPRVTIYEGQMVKLLDQASQQAPCQDQVEGDFAETLAHILAAAPTQPETSANKYASRETVARLYARAGRLTEALVHARIAWESGQNPPAGALLARLYLQAGETALAREVITDLEAVIDRGDHGGQKELERLRGMLATAFATGI